MDGAQFDTLLRQLARVRSRRSALAALLGGGLGVLGATAGEAKHRHKKHRKKRGSAPPPPPPTCSAPCGASEVCANGVCVPCGGAGQPCCSGTVLCGGVCVDTSTDPHNCGGCGHRCQINAICTNGACGCVIPGCANSEATCCPTGTSCACGGAPFYWVDAGTCGSGGEVFVSSCPAGTTPCPGPTCRACCPAGSTCDTSTGTCLQ